MNLSKVDTIGAINQCPLHRNVHSIEITFNRVNKTMKIKVSLNKSASELNNHLDKL